MGEDLFAALRAGVENGSVPQPISGESINDYRFRTAHAGAIIGIKWAQAFAEAAAEAQAEAELLAHLEDVADGLTQDEDDTVQGWRPSGATVAPPIVHAPPVPAHVPPEAAGV
jgi:hypothetical protein